MVAVVSAVQHVGVVAIFMIYPLIIGREAGLPADQIAAILQMGMLALAVAVLLAGAAARPGRQPVSWRRPSSPASTSPHRFWP